MSPESPTFRAWRSADDDDGLSTITHSVAEPYVGFRDVACAQARCSRVRAEGSAAAAAVAAAAAAAGDSAGGGGRPASAAAATAAAVCCWCRSASWIEDSTLVAHASNTPSI
jgi:hypothetical protein